MRLNLATVTLALALTGCIATVPDQVMSLGNDTYSITNNAGLRQASWVELKTAALKKADDYCTYIGRNLTRPKVDSNHATGLRPKEATVTFTCEPPRAQEAKPASGS